MPDMNTIATKQNEKNTIEYLAAGRKLYSRAKVLRGIKFFIGVLSIKKKQITVFGKFDQITDLVFHVFIIRSVNYGLTVFLKSVNDTASGVNGRNTGYCECAYLQRKFSVMK